MQKRISIFISSREIQRSFERQRDSKYNSHSELPCFTWMIFVKWVRNRTHALRILWNEASSMLLWLFKWVNCSMCYLKWTLWCCVSTAEYWSFVRRYAVDMNDRLWHKKQMLNFLFWKYYQMLQSVWFAEEFWKHMSLSFIILFRPIL